MEEEKEKNILDKLKETPDYRKGNAIKHVLSDILMISLLTIICNGNTYAAMHVFGKRHEKTLAMFLELPNGIPSQDTFEDVFAMLSPKSLRDTFRKCKEEIKEAIQAIGGLKVSIDGKTARRSKIGNKRATHIVTALASDLRLVLGEIATEEKSNEITAIPKLLEMFCQKGMVITIDAMGTQTDIASAIISKEADYVLSVKGNQELLHTDIKLLMEYDVMPEDKIKLEESGQYARSIEKDHGRIETRECFITTDLSGLSKPDIWEGLSGFGAIISKREVLGKEPTFNTEYFIFSLENTNASELLNIKRSHWVIENGLHWILDVVFREDDSRARLGNASENLNIFRKEALQLLKSDDSFKGSMTSKRYLASLDLEYALNVLGVK